MKRRQLTILTGVIATLALAQSAYALDLGLGDGKGVHVGGDGVKVDVGGGGDGSGSGVHVGVGNSDGSAASAKANVGNTTATATLGGATTADVDVGTGGKKGTAHAIVDLNGDGVINGKDDALVALDINGDGVLNSLDDVNADGLLSVLDLGSNPAGVTIGTVKLPKAAANVNLNLGSKKTAHAKVDLNGDGILNSKDDALVALDINGDGILSALDDVNADGVLDGVDLGGLDVGTLVGSIGLPIPDIGGSTGGGGGGGNGGRGDRADIPSGGRDGDIPIGQRDIGRVVGSLADHDIIALKVTCADVLGNPGSFDATTISVCRVLARR